MKRLAGAWILLLAGLAGAAEAPGTTAIVNVDVLTMTSETILESRTVIVRDGRIASIGAVESTPVPEEARVVDGTDRYLMPGLTEMHGHIPDADSGDLDRVLTLFVVNGVTTVRGMLGQPSHLALREVLGKGARLGPRLITSGPSFNGDSVEGAEAAARRVREQAAAGYDFLKIHPGLTDAEFSAVAATAKEVGIPFAGHVPADVGVPAALASGIATIDHLDGYMETLVPPNVDPSGGFGGFFGVLLAGAAEEARIAAIAEATAAANVAVVPTESLFEHALSAVDPEAMADWPEMRYMAAATVAGWQASKRNLRADLDGRPALAERAIALRRRLIAALHEAGAVLLLGSDSPQIFNVPGFALHRELAILVEAGLTPFEALRSGTAAPAEFFGRGGSFGTVVPGAAADLVLLDDNPLENVGNAARIHGVMLRGRWLDRRALDALLEGLERASPLPGE